MPSSVVWLSKFLSQADPWKFTGCPRRKLGAAPVQRYKDLQSAHVSAFPYSRYIRFFISIIPGHPTFLFPYLQVHQTTVVDVTASHILAAHAKGSWPYPQPAPHQASLARPRKTPRASHTLSPFVMRTVCPTGTCIQQTQHSTHSTRHSLCPRLPRAPLAVSGNNALIARNFACSAPMRSIRAPRPVPFRHNTHHRRPFFWDERGNHDHHVGYQRFPKIVPVHPPEGVRQASGTVSSIYFAAVASSLRNDPCTRTRLSFQTESFRIRRPSALPEGVLVFSPPFGVPRKGSMWQDHSSSSQLENKSVHRVPSFWPIRSRARRICLGQCSTHSKNVSSPRFRTPSQPGLAFCQEIFAINGECWFSCRCFHSRAHCYRLSNLRLGPPGPRTSIRGLASRRCSDIHSNAQQHHSTFPRRWRRTQCRGTHQPNDRPCDFQKRNRQSARRYYHRGRRRRLLAHRYFPHFTRKNTRDSPRRGYIHHLDQLFEQPATIPSSTQSTEPHGRSWCQTRFRCGSRAYSYLLSQRL